MWLRSLLHYRSLAEDYLAQNRKSIEIEMCELNLLTLWKVSGTGHILLVLANDILLFAGIIGCGCKVEKHQVRKVLQGMLKLTPASNGLYIPLTNSSQIGSAMS